MSALPRPARRLLLITVLLGTFLYTIFAVTKLSVENRGFTFRLRERPKLLPFSESEEDTIELNQPTTSSEPFRDLQILSSKRNPYGFIKAIDFETNIYNPALLQLPRGSKYEYVVLGRLEQTPEIIGDKEYMKGREAAFFANVRYDGLGQPVLTQIGDWHTTIVDDIGLPDHYCASDEKLQKYIGPEDMRLWWTKAGAPLLLFTNQLPLGSYECQGMFVIDARATLGELNDALGENAKRLPPIEFDKPRQLRQPHPQEREKNWAPFQTAFDEDPDKLFFHVQLQEPRIFTYELDQEAVLPISPAGMTRIEQPFPPLANTPSSRRNEKPERTCIQDVVDAFKNDGVHQATPILSMTLCNRGECVQDVHNTVLFGIVHGKRRLPVRTYEPRVISWNATRPFVYRSVSKRLSYHGTRPREWIWTGSMTYHWSNSDIPVDRSHGYLDDEIWLGFGIHDETCGWLDVDARELVRDHYYCEVAG